MFFLMISSPVFSLSAIQHNKDYVVFFISQNKSQPPYLSLVFPSRGNNIDTRRIDAGVSQDIRQFRDILFHIIISPRKQVAQIVGKYLSGAYARFPAQRFHLSPDIAPVPGFPALCHKDRAGTDFLSADILSQNQLQLLGQEYLAAFSLAGHLRASPQDCVYSNKRKLADADACGADRLQGGFQTFFLLPSGCLHQFSVLFL